MRFKMILLLIGFLVMATPSYADPVFDFGVDEHTGVTSNGEFIGWTETTLEITEQDDAPLLLDLLMPEYVRRFDFTLQGVDFSIGGSDTRFYYEFTDSIEGSYIDYDFPIDFQGPGLVWKNILEQKISFGGYFDESDADYTLTADGLVVSMDNGNYELKCNLKYHEDFFDGFVYWEHRMTNEWMVQLGYYNLGQWSGGYGTVSYTW